MTSDVDAARIFEAAVMGLRDRHEFRGFVDPRPVRIAADIAYPDPSDYYERADPETAARREVLERMGIDTTKSFPLISNCGPLMAPPGRKVTDGCPQGRAEAAFDRVRRSSTGWVIRTIWINYGRSGRSAFIADLMISRRNGDYRFDSERILAYID